jgi:hypothetical protein
MAGDEIIKIEKDSIDRFVALGLGRYDAITAVDAGIDSRAVESLVRESGCPVTVALQMVRY